MIETLITNADKLDNIGLVGFMMMTIIYQWWDRTRLEREYRKENKELLQINNEVISEMKSIAEGIKKVAESNEKTNERIDYFFIKK